MWYPPAYPGPGGLHGDRRVRRSAVRPDHRRVHGRPNGPVATWGRGRQGALGVVIGIAAFIGIFVVSLVASVVVEILVAMLG